jgi:hypothetical protein
VFTRELRTLLETRHAEHERLKRKGKVVPWVFFRMVALGRGGPLRPKPIKSIAKQRPAVRPRHDEDRFATTEPIDSQAVVN